MPIGDKPILEILIKQLKNHGITELIIAVGYLHNMIESYFKDGKEFGVNIKYSLEKEPLGTAGPLALIQEQLQDNFIVLNGDLLTTIDFKKLFSDHIQFGASATIAAFQREVHVDYGVIEKNNDHNLTGYIEKPSLKYDVSMGINVFNKKHILKHLKKNVYLDIPDLMELLLAEKRSKMPYPIMHVVGYWQN